MKHVLDRAAVSLLAGWPTVGLDAAQTSYRRAQAWPTACPQDAPTGRGHWGRAFGSSGRIDPDKSGFVAFPFGWTG